MLLPRPCDKLGKTFCANFAGARVAAVFILFVRNAADPLMLAPTSEWVFAFILSPVNCEDPTRPLAHIKTIHVGATPRLVCFVGLLVITLKFANHEQRPPFYQSYKTIRYSSGICLAIEAASTVRMWRVFDFSTAASSEQMRLHSPVSEVLSRGHEKPVNVRRDASTGSRIRPTSARRAGVSEIGRHGPAWPHIYMGCQPHTPVERFSVKSV